MGHTVTASQDPLSLIGSPCKAYPRFPVVVPLKRSSTENNAAERSRTGPSNRSVFVEIKVGQDSIHFGYAARYFEANSQINGGLRKNFAIFLSEADPARSAV